jgi:hypothetical protein
VSVIIAAVEEEIIGRHAHSIAEMSPGCAELFRKDKRNELKLMFQLFNRVPATLYEITPYFQQHIQSRG